MSSVLPQLDSQSISVELARINSESSQLLAFPERAAAIADRLSLLGSAVTAACEQAFLDATERAAA